MLKSTAFRPSEHFTRLKKKIQVKDGKNMFKPAHVPLDYKLSHMLKAHRKPISVPVPASYLLTFTQSLADQRY